MKSEQASVNRLWSRLILESLTRHGVEDICIAPGSRSTPLTLEAQANRKLTLHTHFDERGLGFLALGLAKASQRRVAIVTTSGTAVANLLPAIAEANLTGEKLIVLSADRPKELVNVGANQAIEQRGIFSSHVTGDLQLPSPSLQHSAPWLVGSVDALVGRQVYGPVHINCPFPEPLYGDEPLEVSDYLEPLTQWFDGDTPFDRYLMPKQVPIVPAQWPQMQQEKGVILAGQLPPHVLSEVKVLARRLGWPLLADVQSGGSSAWRGYDIWLNNEACREHFSQATFVLQLGARFVSKRLGQWLADFRGEHWIVEPSPRRLQPEYSAHTRIKATVAEWVNVALETVSSSQHADWAAELAALPQPWQQQGFDELSIAANVLNAIDEGVDLFVGNSLVVRLLDMLADQWQTAVFTNRGASGIDGLTATIAGVQRARQKPMLALMGDTSCLYDLNSLGLLAHAGQPLVLTVINNDGGGIFDMLPVPEQQKSPLYRMPHGLDFEHAARMFGLDYYAPQSLADLFTQIASGLKQPRVTLIEVKTPAGEAGQLLKDLLVSIKNDALLG
ncbi:2-succinyl-5-enolpyruvyl-6-hydroxy-3-cyclohexene-1-carboxylic-acid synthase [Thaumasiovibrio subtropicus]|uniref:2-succinyl-5-enolpyruvyl-6-hydroxy-3- cyclohexene-1-carboxylic-acid synthase n=1 Tax=Thaumasiovibrio subtropicus TaxID=1891207 RepID=UPI000B35E3E9|nr:2-succinyl-5-enolpyruvyl-6-hydroxy-3-cyclohexene-1-carboxylic-acid synthase [Thaumasiovibrio subtropicus]